jgi:hypothetical protein
MPQFLTGSLIGFVAYWLYWLDCQITLAPDSVHYLKLAQRERVPMPFCFRWFWPRVMGRRWGADVGAWAFVTTLAMILLGAAAGHRYGPLGAALLCFSPFVRFNVSRPALVDVLPFASTCAAAWLLPSEWYWLIGAGMLVGAMRESAPIWLAAYTGSPWPLLGLLVLPYGLTLRRPVDPDEDSPFLSSYRAVQYFKVGKVLRWQTQLAPWGAFLATIPYLSPMQWGWIVLGYAPQTIATDTARIFYWAAPIVLPTLLALPLPTEAWAALLIVHIFNPYREV